MRHHFLSLTLLAVSIAACGGPLEPSQLEGTFVLPLGVEVPVGDPVTTTSWVIADTLRFRADGTGEQRGALEHRIGAPLRVSTYTYIRFERRGEQVWITWYAPCHPACDVATVTTEFRLQGSMLYGEIGSAPVAYERSSAHAP